MSNPSGFFFFKQKTAYEMRISDWSSDVCSSDLVGFLSVGILSTSRKLPPVDDVMPVDIVDIAAVPSTPRPVPRTAPEQGPDETPEETAEPEEQTPAPEPEPVPDPTPAPKPAPAKPQPETGRAHV